MFFYRSAKSNSTPAGYLQDGCTETAKMLKVQREEVRTFIEECLVSVEAPLKEARAHADLLLHADSTGHFSHGLNRLGGYRKPIFVFS